MSTAPCWISRGEAWTGGEDLVEQCERLTPEQDATLEALIEAKCAITPCRQDEPLPEPQLVGAPGWCGCGNGYCVCAWDVMSELCELDEGHAGPHLFESTANILLVFPAHPGEGTP